MTVPLTLRLSLALLALAIWPLLVSNMRFDDVVIVHGGYLSLGDSEAGAHFG